ncbi:SDR family oxidoreductase [Rhodococcus sp. NPDC019627]|uniref:SDR family oxidoreductase n=1 Tax=unclassified Rhodococcus (in: high G+C Gram-positive bacteria) TaxID=192944 RepID=UPI0033F17CDA
MSTDGQPDIRTAVVTGASSGIGEATARTLAARGFHVVLGARRLDRCQVIADDIGGTAIELDITSDQSVSDFAGRIDDVSVLVNNAGGARGLSTIAEADIDEWRWMWETNVLGTLRLTRALIPALLATKRGVIVTVTSTAALEIYPGGGGYTSAKHSERVLHRMLEAELADTPIRFTEVSPGIVETDFSLKRFDGDTDRAAGVYEGITPLTAQDVAEVIAYAADCPENVTLEHIVMRPRAQADSTHIHRDD